MTALRIQLNPIDLGTVVATLNFAGDRLRVDIAVTTDAAHRRLSADRDAITRALGDLGFDVDQVDASAGRSTGGIRHDPARRHELRCA